MGLAWQFLFLALSTDPLRYRVMILPSIAEKVIYGISLVTLYLKHRLALSALGLGSVDWIFAVLFIASYIKTRPERAGVSR